MEVSAREWGLRELRNWNRKRTVTACNRISFPHREDNIAPPLLVADNHRIHLQRILTIPYYKIYAYFTNKLGRDQGRHACRAVLLIHGMLINRVYCIY